MSTRASSIDVRLRLRGQRQFKREVASSAATLEAMGLKGAKALGKFAQQSQRLKDVGASLTRNVTLPLLAVGGASVKMFMDFDDSMNKMVGLVGISRKQVQGWHEDVLNISELTGESPTELADALFFITSAGLRGKTAIDALTASAKAADSGLGETKTIADAVTSAMNAYGPANLSAARATDILTAAVRYGKMEASALAPVIGSVLPMAQAAGVSFDEVAGSMALMSKSGTNAAKGATQVTAILSTFAKPTTAMKEALDDMGLSLGEVRRMIARKGLLEAVDMLSNRTKAYGIDLSEVFGNKRAITGVLQLTKNLKDSRTVLDGVANSTGMSNKAFREAQKTAGDKTADALNSLRVMAIRLGATIGPTLAPMISDLAKFIGDLGKKFSALSPRARKNILIFAGVAAALGPALSVLGYFAGGVGRALIATAKFVKFTKAVIAFGKGFMALRAGVGTLTALKVALAGFGLTLRGIMMTTGIGLAITAIILLNEKFHFLGPTIEFVTKILKKAFDWIKAAAGNVIGWLKTNWPILLVVLTGPLGLAVVAITGHWDKIKSVITGVVSSVLSWLKGAWANIKNTVVGAVHAVLGFLQKNWKTIVAILLGPIGIATALIIAKWDTIKAAAGSVVSFVVGKFNGLVGFFASVPGRLAGAGLGVFNFLKESFRSAINFIIRAWNSLEFKIPGFDPPGPGPKFGGMTIGVPDIPELALGGAVMRRGSALVGERGPELLDLPTGARVRPLDPAPLNLRGQIGGIKTIVVKSILDGKVIAQSTAKVAEDEAAYS